MPLWPPNLHFSSEKSILLMNNLHFGCCRGTLGQRRCRSAFVVQALQGCIGTAALQERICRAGAAGAHWDSGTAGVHLWCWRALRKRRCSSAFVVQALQGRIGTAALSQSNEQTTKQIMKQTKTNPSNKQSIRQTNTQTNQSIKQAIKQTHKQSNKQSIKQTIKQTKKTKDPKEGTLWKN